MEEQWVHHPAFQDIRGSVRRSWILQLLGYGVLTIILLVGIWFLSGVMRLIPWIALCGPIWAIYRLVVRKHEFGSILYSILIKAPEKIVWIYGYQLTRAPLGIVLSRHYRIFFQTSDRKSYSLDIPENRYLVVMKWLNRALPHAVFGWKDERHQRWIQDGVI